MKLIIEEPFKSIIDDEWNRAKKLLPVLRRKPDFYWDNSNGLKGYYGMCNRKKNRIRVHRGFKDLIDTKEFVLLIRHEIAHLPKPSYGQGSHGPDFIWWMERLEGSRYVSKSLTQLKKLEKAN